MKKKSIPDSTNRGKASTKSAGNFWLRYGVLILTAAVLLLYLPSLRFGFTELDDSIFIKETKDYNEDLSNLITSFKRGVFNETNDVYYRPLLLDSFILNYHLSGTNIQGWHVVNVILHLFSVLLLFRLLKKNGIPDLHSFLLSLLFAVHPVLSQAVAWIPGRNDTLLAIFVFAFLIGAIDYNRDGKLSALILQFAALTGALFTKETGVFAAPVGFVILVLLHRRKMFERRNLILYSTWTIAGLTWFFLRSAATLKNEQLQFNEIIQILPARLPVLLQYLGKIFFPVNLSVFPIMTDTTYLYGILALFFLGAIIFLAPQKDFRVIISGIVIYVLLFIPALMVPASLNNQDFEHRTYLPMIGILISLSQTVLLRNKWSINLLTASGLAVCTVLAFINIRHQKNFNDPVTFWSAAVKTSPNSAYANMMLGARLDDIDKPGAEDLIRRAYELDSNEKYINYYMGVLLQEYDSILASEKYFLKELDISDYYQCYFHLARVAFEKADKPEAIFYLEKYLNRNPSDSQANHNLLLLYIETNEIQKARTQAERMRQFGIPVPEELQNRLN